MNTEYSHTKPTEFWIESLNPILRTPYSEHTLPIVRGNRKYPIIHALKKKLKPKPKTTRAIAQLTQRPRSLRKISNLIGYSQVGLRSASQSKCFWCITYRTPYYSSLLLLLILLLFSGTHKETHKENDGHTAPPRPFHMRNLPTWVNHQD